MALSPLDPLRDAALASVRSVRWRVTIRIVTVALAIVAIGLLVSGMLVALTKVTGFPVAATVFAAIFALLSSGVYLAGQVLKVRRTQEAAAARQRAIASLALTSTVARSARPLLPLAAFVAAFVFARRP